MARTHKERPNRCVYFVRIAKRDDLVVNFGNPSTARLRNKILIHLVRDARRVRQDIFGYRQPYL